MVEGDMPREVELLFRRRLMQRFGVERLRLACDMFDSAVAMVAASLPPSMAGEGRVRPPTSGSAAPVPVREG
jgi:hypothetical protein